MYCNRFVVDLEQAVVDGQITNVTVAKLLVQHGMWERRPGGYVDTLAFRALKQMMQSGQRADPEDQNSLNVG